MLAVVQFAELLSAGGARRIVRATFAQARRDAAMVGLTLRGKSPPPTIARSSTARPDHGPSRTAELARALRIARVVRETNDAVTLQLVDPTGAPIDYVPGQFFTVLVDVDGETLRRAYSICSGPGEAVAITVKRLAHGRVSSRLVESAREGDVLRVLGPSGSFGEGARDARRLVMIAGGSGITPLASIAKHSKKPVFLLYGNRSASDVIFRSALEALSASHPARVEVRHVFGPVLDARVIDAEIGREGSDSHYLLCGPTPMMEASRGVLAARGVPASRIHEELFVRPELRTTGVDSGPQDVVVHVKGKRLAVRTAPGQTILDAALAAGAPMPFSCAMGGCGECKSRLVRGTVEMESPNCLSDDERARGEILACVSHATSACEVEVA